MVPMRDGVRLASDVYWPAQDGRVLPGPFPTILLRTSYDKMAARYVDGIANYFTPRGYATVMQDLRGRYASEGTGQYYHCSNVNEGRDGFDTVAQMRLCVKADQKLAREPSLDTIAASVGYGCSLALSVPQSGQR